MKKLLKIFGTVLIIIVSVFVYNLNTTNAQALCPVGYTCVSQPSITLKSPNGLEGFVINSSEIPVKWVSNYESKNVKVKLYTTSGVEKFSSSYLDNKIGENTYTIPKNGADIAGSYTVKVCDDSRSPVGLPSSILCDSSDDAFMVSTLADISDNPVVEKVQSLAGDENVLYSGEKFSIQGKNLLAYASGNTKVVIGAVEATITQINNNLIWVTAPKLSAGYFPLYVNNENGKSNVVNIKVVSSDVARDPRCPAGYTCNFTNDSSTSNSIIKTVYLTDSSVDKAGIWNKFSPGIGNVNRTSSDWNWFLELNPLPANTSISSITVTNDSVSEGWSTSVSDVYGRAPYPLVVLDNLNKQLNTAYDQKNFIPSLYTKNNEYFFYLSGQRESSVFSGGTLTIKLSDGTVASAKISALVPNYIASYTPTTNSCYRFNTNLSLDTSQGSDDVIALQKFLISKNYTNMTVNSVFDQNTKQAVIKYQTSIGLPATGFVGPLTRNVLNRCLINLDDQSNSGNSSGSNNSSASVVQITSHTDGQSVYMEKRMNDGTYLAQLNFSASTNISGTYSAKWVFKDVSGKFGTQTSSDIRYTSGSNIQALQALNGPAKYEVTLEVTDSNGKVTISKPITLYVNQIPQISTTVDNSKYCYTFNKDLSIETAGQGVSVSTTEGVSIFNLQTLLVDKEKINVDSNERNVKTPIFNASTRQAVIAFQKKYGINPTGYVGPVTRAKLNELYGCKNVINQSPIQTNIPQVITTPQQVISVPEAQQVQKYYQNTTVSNVRLTQNNGYRVNAGSVLQKGQKYTIDWDASGVPESARFTIVVQSPTNPTIYGVIKTGLLGPTKRSFEWTIDTPFIENTDLQIIVQTNDVKASSPIFKVASTPVSAVVVPSTPVVVVPSIKSISPSSGLPGTKVTLTLSNPKKIALSEGDFAFGQYGFTNFTNSNNEVVTFTIPSDAKAGVYDVVWFGDDAYSTKFTVTYPSGTSSAIDWYYPIFGSKSR